ncbi:uncharacterized protein LOC101855341 [Aplysia californica]|uniref:Uncharacterized protein LOC101855341 n=1 Tax=Aplysia californica TaxID=6500 RepID=A0ABM1VU64_APLCA|nr:uncharacterized protein LOC101855341 [Aplysia californica]
MKILTGQKTFKCLPPLNLATCTKEDIKEYFNNSYDLNESLFLALKDESVFYVYPDKLRLPLIFYYAHTAVVFINKLILAGLLRKRINLEYETMFETGVNELAWDDTENYRLGGRLQWPCLADVVKYRIEARELILKVIEDTELHLPITMDSPWWAVMMGIEHERVHVETSSVLIRQLPVDMVSKPDGWKYGPLNAGEPVVKNKMLAQNETTVVEIGKPSNHPSYGWDIDYGHDSWSVPPFEANQFPVTNREFLEFVKDGGYSQQALWTHEGWTWRESAETKHPVFWVCRAGFDLSDCNGGGIGCGSSSSDESGSRNKDSNSSSNTCINVYISY